MNDGQLVCMEFYSTFAAGLHFFWYQSFTIIFVDELC